MRIALCLSGHFRGFTICLPTWKQHLFDCNNAQFDIFLCTGHTIEYSSNRPIERELRLLRDNTNLINVQREYDVTPDDLFIQRNGYNRPIRTLISMWYKIKIANDLKCQYEEKHGFKYDCVIKFRPDIFLKTPITLNNIDLTQWHIPKYGDFRGLNDQIAWSNSSNIDYYCTLFDGLKTYLLEDEMQQIHPEFYMMYKWQQSGCKLQRPNILYQLARTIHYLVPDNEERERSQGFI